MKKNDLKEMSAADLKLKAQELRRDLFNMRLQQTTGQLEKPSRIREVRKDIARLETQKSALRNKAA